LPETAFGVKQAPFKGIGALAQPFHCVGLLKTIVHVFIAIHLGVAPCGILILLFFGLAAAKIYATAYGKY